MPLTSKIHLKYGVIHYTSVPFNSSMKNETCNINMHQCFVQTFDVLRFSKRTMLSIFAQNFSAHHCPHWDTFIFNEVHIRTLYITRLIIVTMLYTTQI